MEYHFIQKERGSTTDRFMLVETGFFLKIALSWSLIEGG